MYLFNYFQFSSRGAIPALNRASAARAASPRRTTPPSNNQSNCLRRLKRIPEAEHTYTRRALAAEPSDARYQQGLGTVLHEAGRAHEAVTLYLTAQQLQRQRGERGAAGAPGR